MSPKVLYTGMQLRRQIERSPLGTEVPREQLAELSVSAYELQKIRQRVRLLGTGEVNTCALRMEDAVFKVADDLAALSKAISNSDPAVRDFGLIHDESVGAAAEAHSDFIDAVRAVVGDRKNDPS
jgi:hypothetical protein